MFCGKCGSPVADGMKFCTKCGAEVRLPKSAAAVNDAVPVQAEPEEKTGHTVSEPVNPETKTGNTVSAPGNGELTAEKKPSEREKDIPVPEIKSDPQVLHPSEKTEILTDPVQIPPTQIQSVQIQPAQTLPTQIPPTAAIAVPYPASPGEVKKKRANPLVFVVIAAALLIVAAVVLYITVFSESAKNRREIREQLEMAERYLDDLEYEKAIAAYQAVLEIDPRNEDALKALEDAYIEWAQSLEDTDPLAARGIYEEAAVYLELLDNRAGEEIAARSRERIEERLEALYAKGDAAESDPEREDPESAVTSGSLTVTVFAANLDEVLPGAEVTIRSANGVNVEITADEIGRAEFSDLEPGEYTIQTQADGYNSREQEVSVTGNTSSMIALAPEIVGDDACVLLTWEGDQDLDICGFNEDIQEYTNLAQVTDSINSMILFGDHGADKGYEFLYVHDLSYEVIKSIYVVDAENARSGQGSRMERDGVHIYAYDKDGEALALTADTARTAPLWYPFYMYAGDFYTEDEYITDMTDQTWISYEESDQTVKQYTADDALEAYATYIAGAGWTDPFTCYCIYLNDDKVPELIADFGYAAAGSVILTYGNSGIEECLLQRGEFSYWEKQNCIDNSAGNSGVYTTNLLMIENGEFVCFGSGSTMVKEEYYNVNWDLDEAWECEWEGETLSLSQFEARKASLCPPGEGTSNQAWQLGRSYGGIETLRAAYRELQERWGETP